MSPLPLERAAALAGGHCWAERRLFELLGAWSAVAPTAAATLVLDRHAQHAAWRGDQWWDRLPILAGVDRIALVAPPRSWATLGGAGIDPVGPDGAGDPLGPDGAGDPLGPDGAGDPVGPDGTGDPAGPDGTGMGQATAGPSGPTAGIARLAVAYRVLLPRLAVGYARHAAATTPVADGAVRRTLGQVRADVSADWAEGEGVLQELLDGPGAVDAAAAAVAAAERRFVA